MERSISKRKSVKASTAKPSVKPLSADKALYIDPAFHFYLIEDDDKTKEVEEEENPYHSKLKPNGN